ncbi:MAG: DUF2188 domain-containing protein [Proteobacteria bacterium]|nr:DUF2188 domain-containing protein [Pseudomonadota bacterium]MBW3616577.1 DUF2188 domain-containing protein [Pseudomonadota bacterium]
MSNIAYVVASEGRSWKLLHQGRPAGRFDGEDQALGTAIGLAREAFAVGHDAVVMIEDEDGTVREAWRQEHAG